MDVPVKDLPKGDLKKLLKGTGERIPFRYETEGRVRQLQIRFEGVLNNLERRFRETGSDMIREQIENYMSNKPCPTCQGARLRKESLGVRVGGQSIDTLTSLSIREAREFFSHLELTEKERVIGRQILKEIDSRLGFLINVGLDYLTLNRAAGTLSGGEAQRIRLATQIGSKLMGVLYILDEPSIGLHQRDNAKLIRTLEEMRDLGNTLIVVEHDEDTMLAADHIIDVGPGAGTHGGRIVAQGTPEEVMAMDHSLTGQYLSGRKFIPLPESGARWMANGWRSKGPGKTI